MQCFLIILVVLHRYENLNALFQFDKIDNVKLKIRDYVQCVVIWEKVLLHEYVACS